MWQNKKPDQINPNQTKSIWLILVAVFIVILAILLFGKTYWQKQETALFDEKQLFEQISDLKGQIAQLQENISKKEEPEKPMERTVITKETMPKIINCGDDTFYDIPKNVDHADKTVVYLNQDKNISLDVPYNESWGTRQYKLNPYEETKNEETVTGLEFGPTIILGGAETKECDWIRKYSLTFLPAGTITKTLSEIKKIDSNAEKKEINGYTVIEYRDGKTFFELLTSSVLVRVLDKNASYEFRQIIEPWSSVLSGFEDLENIVKTLKLLEQN